MKFFTIVQMNVEKKYAEINIENKSAEINMKEKCDGHMVKFSVGTNHCHTHFSSSSPSGIRRDEPLPLNEVSHASRYCGFNCSRTAHVYQESTNVR